MLRTALFLVLLTPGMALAGDGPIRVDDAYARGPGPAPVGAVFMSLTNTGDAPDRLVGVASDAAQRVELHTHTADADGVMRMGPLEGGIALAAGESHSLKRGGDHVMLMGLAAPLETGSEIEITLTFERAGEITVTVPVDNERMDPGHNN